MPFEQPTLQDLIRQSRQEVSARLKKEDQGLVHVLDVLCMVHAGMMHSLYETLGYAEKSLLFDYAEGRYLDTHAQSMGLMRLNGSPAKGMVRVRATQSGYIQKGTQLESQNGTSYITTQNASLNQSLEDGIFEAVLPVASLEFGMHTNQNEGSEFSWNVVPLSGGDLLLSQEDAIMVDPTLAQHTQSIQAHLGGVQGGNEAESDGMLRARLLQARRPSFCWSVNEFDLRSIIQNTRSDVHRVWLIANSDQYGSTCAVCASQTQGSQLSSVSQSALDDVNEALKNFAPMGMGAHAQSIVPVLLEIRVRQGFSCEVESIIRTCFAQHLSPNLNLQSLQELLKYALMHEGALDASDALELLVSSEDYPQTSSDASSMWQVLNLGGVYG